MTDDECRRLCQQLIKLLQRLELQWVVELFKQEINAGKLILQEEEYRQIPERSIRDFQEDVQLRIQELRYIEAESDSSRRRQTSLMAIEYSDSEKLKILISFVKQAVVDTTFLESEVVRYFRDDSIFVRRNSLIRFTDAADDASAHELSLDNIADKEAHARNLNALLNEILEEMNNAPQR